MLFPEHQRLRSDCVNIIVNVVMIRNGGFLNISGNSILPWVVLVIWKQDRKCCKKAVILVTRHFKGSIRNTCLSILGRSLPLSQIAIVNSARRLLTVITESCHNVNFVVIGSSGVSGAAMYLVEGHCFAAADLSGVDPYQVEWCLAGASLITETAPRRGGSIFFLFRTF